MSVFGFPPSLFDRLAYEQSSWKLPAYLPNIQNVLTNSLCWQCHCTLLCRYFINSYYSTRCWNFLLCHLLYQPNFQKSFIRNFMHQLSLAQNCQRKHFCFDAAVFHLSIKGYCKTRPDRSYCFMSMFKLHCKRHYRNMATHRWCTTWREHVRKNCASATPTFGRRRRRTAL